PEPPRLDVQYEKSKIECAFWKTDKGRSKAEKCPFLHSPKKDGCLRCGAADHWVRDCKRPKKSDKNRSEGKSLGQAKGDRSKLGTLFSAVVNRNGMSLTIINAYTQFNHGGQGTLIDYEALKRVLATVKDKFCGLRIGYPKIGAGLGGGDWNLIKNIIDVELAGEDHTLVEFESEIAG
ncbi:MAG: hypothetical protein AAF939_16280, partial [Planctomycetota bacterium]